MNNKFEIKIKDQIKFSNFVCEKKYNDEYSLPESIRIIKNLFVEIKFNDFLSLILNQILKSRRREDLYLYLYTCYLLE